MPKNKKSVIIDRDLDNGKINGVLDELKESARKSGQSLEDKVLNDLDRGLKVESLEGVQFEARRILNWGWDYRLKNARLNTAPIIKDPSGLKEIDAKGKERVRKIPSPSYIEGRIRPIVNTEPQGRTASSCLGFFQANRFQDSETGELLGVVNICPEFFDRNKPQYHEELNYEFANVVLHEAVHMLNSANGLKDCSKQRHNLQFKETAEYLGLVCYEDGKDKKIGFGRTRLGEDLKARIDELNIDTDQLKIFARTLDAKKSDRKPAAKWICSNPQCGLGIDEDGNEQGGSPQQFRTSSDRVFNIMCMDCSVDGLEYYFERVLINPDN